MLGGTIMDNSFIYKSDRPWPNDRLKHGAIVGHTTHNEALIWVRTRRPGKYTFLYYPAQDRYGDDPVFNGFGEVPYTKLDTLPDYVKRVPIDIPDWDKDTTEVVQLTNLKPFTEYRYALFGKEEDKERILLGKDNPYRFRTLQKKSAPLSFAFYSCHMPYRTTLFGKTQAVNIDMWQYLKQVLDRHYDSDLGFVIAGGDQVYTDGVGTLDIWKYLNNKMCRKDGKLYPETETMVGWYRDIYRGYWGFTELRLTLANYPTYMIWDDHDLGDGWGSYYLEPGKKDEIDEIFPSRKAKKLSRKDCLTLLDRMKQAASQTYIEYQHSHNPKNDNELFDYDIDTSAASFYVLDGRGNRDINRQTKKILGQTQFNRFKKWLNTIVKEKKNQYVFIVSAVPVLHLSPITANSDNTLLSDISNLQDDLRDSWEHKIHNAERRALLKLLFAAAKQGLKICILSGDVHMGAVFKMTDNESSAVIYQLTSSPITYNKSLWLRAFNALDKTFSITVQENGESKDGYKFERLALYTDSNFSLVKIDPKKEALIYHGYTTKSLEQADNSSYTISFDSSTVRLTLDFK